MSGAQSYSLFSTGTTPIDMPQNRHGHSASTSGATTPQNGRVSTSASFYGLPSLRSAWSGLVRTFSYDDSQYPTDMTNIVIREPPPPEPVSLSGWKPTTSSGSRVLTVPLAEEIRKMIPERLQIVDGWNLVYSLVQDGTLLGTLYRKCAEFSEKRRGQRIGFVLALRDDEGGVFGAYMSDVPHISKSYYGNGECFLWRASRQAPLPPRPSEDTSNVTRNTTIPSVSTSPDRRSNSSLKNASTNGTPSIQVRDSVRFQVYPYSGKNDYCILCEPRFLSLGAGDGHYGLWMNENLSAGHSDPCPTFDNEHLSDQGGKFGIIGVEVWAISS